MLKNNFNEKVALVIENLRKDLVNKGLMLSVQDDIFIFTDIGEAIEHNKTIVGKIEARKVLEDLDALMLNIGLSNFKK